MNFRGQGLKTLLAGVLSVAMLSLGMQGITMPAASATDPWFGTASLTTSSPTTDADSTTATLTVTLSAPLVSPYAVSIYDDQGARMMCNSSLTSTFTLSVAPANNATRTYTAYVAKDCPTPSVGGPTNDVRTGSGSVTVQNLGYTGSASLTSDRPTTDANTPSATLTVTLTKPLASPYLTSIYDDLGNRVMCSGSLTSYFTASATPANNASRTYTAYVAQDCPVPGPPHSDVRTSSSQSISNLGYTGSLTLTASASTTDANTPSSTLTLALSKTLASPYLASIYDDLGTRVMCSSSLTSTFTAVVAPATNTSRTYTAYVAQNCPSPSVGGPTSDVHASGSVSVQNVGYTGSGSLSSNRASTDANNPSATLTYTLTKPLPSPYSVSIYDDLGTRIMCSSSVGYSTFTASVTPATNATRTYTAYVGQGCPTPGPVTNDVRTSSALSITNLGYTGSVSLTSSTGTTDANNPSATLTVSLAPALPSPYSLSIYDDQGARIMCSSSLGNGAFTASVTPATNATRTYTAYVAQGCPSPGPPTIDVHASGAVSVHNAGWTGGGTLTTNRGATDTANPNATLTLTLDKTLASPYAVSFYSDQTRIACSSTFTTVFTVSVTPPLNDTGVYTAYVAQDCPTAGPPENDVRLQQSLAVTNTGWMGSLTLASNGATPSPQLTATIGTTLLNSPYALSLYDGTTRLACMSATTSMSLTTTVTPPNPGSSNYAAFVAQDCPTSSLPQNDVRGAVGLLFTDGAFSGTTNGNISVGGVASLLSSMSDDDIAFLLLMAPGTHFQSTSTSDQYNEYAAARGAGKTIQQAIQAALDVSAVAGSGWLLWVWTHAQPTPAPPAPPTTPQPVPTPPSTDPFPNDPTAPDYTDYLTSLYLQRNTKISEQVARRGAKQCLAVVQKAIGDGALPATLDGKNPCEARDVIFPGSTWPLTTDHDWQALFGPGTHNLEWVQQNYVSRPDRIASGLGSAWASQQPECAGQVQVKVTACDEVPWFSTAQSGPGASLRPLDWTDNSGGGGRYGVFVKACGLTSGGPVADMQRQQGTPFLMIPMDFTGAPRSFHICKNGGQ